MSLPLPIDFSHGGQAWLPNTQWNISPAKDSVDCPQRDDCPIHTVIKSNTLTWLFISPKLVQIPGFLEKSRLGKRKDRSERKLLSNRTLFQGGRLPPSFEQPLVNPLAAWNLEQHGDRGTVVDGLRAVVLQ
jgi:hypothetical protein